MTLAIAGEYPWGDWRRVTDSAPGHFQRAVILAADTRWSYRDRPPFDRGRKLWTLGRQAGLLLAGDVRAGEDGIRCLYEAGKDAGFSKATDVTALAEKTFQEAYSSHIRSAETGRRPPVHRLYYLMGLVDADGYTALVRFASEANFSPIFLSGVYAIGVAKACQDARTNLLEEIGKIRDGENLGPDADPWAMAAAAAIDSIIQSKGHVPWAVPCSSSSESRPDGENSE